MTVACVKLKLTLPNIVIRDGSRMPVISRMERFVAIALHWKPLTFVVESSILGLGLGLGFLYKFAHKIYSSNCHNITTTLWKQKK